MNLNTFQISQCIANKDYTTAELAITDFIRSNTGANDILGIPVKNVPLGSTPVDQEQVCYTFCEQFVTLITQLFSAPRYKPSITTINTFFSCKFVIEWLFSASLWRNTDALIEHLQLMQTDRLGNLKFNEKRLTLLLMLITLSSKYKLPWKLLLKAMPNQTLSAYIGLVTQPIPAITKESNAGFNYSLESAKDFPLFDLPVVEDLGKLNYPFFACSYATSPNKYEFKKWLTKLIRHNIPQWLSSAVKQHISEISPLPTKQKKKLGVMLELFSKDHAMYRCFNSTIDGLSEQYELIAFTDKKEADNSDLTAFNKMVIFQDIFDINANAELILKESIDMLFYPSIGMKFWGIYLSQLRLAPIQMMMGGHPSSSFSPEIDYFLLPVEQQQAVDCQPYISEKIITSEKPYRELSAHVMHSDLTPSFIELHNHFIEDSDNIRIAINGVMTKVSYDIIDVCKRIQDRSTKTIVFVFFTTYKSDQLGYLSAKNQLKRSLKHFEVSPFTDYLGYMRVISKCHMLLPTLPFGGSNSNIDAMVLNKPKFFIKGNAQLYTKSDLWEWERLGLVDELGCENQNELIDKSVNIIESNTSRKLLYDLMTKKCTIANIFTNENKVNETLTHLFSQTIVQEEINATE